MDRFFHTVLLTALVVWLVLWTAALTVWPAMRTRPAPVPVDVTVIELPPVAITVTRGIGSVAPSLVALR